MRESNSNKTMSHQTFKSTNSFLKRVTDSTNIRSKYPNRIPIICERSPGQKSNIPYIDKNKYLVPKELTVGQFLYIIRSKMKLDSSIAIFLFVGNVLPSSSTELGDLDQEYRDEDGFLYTKYAGESSFGSVDQMTKLI